MPAPLLLCDTPGLLYRGFFALPDSIKGAEGRPVNALVGSVNMTLWCIEKYKPRAVVMCFGQESADYRTEAYPDYHAARPPMPDDLAWQWERAPALYEALGWTVLGHENLEADDLMGSFAAIETEARRRVADPHRATATCSSAPTTSVTILLQKARQQGPDEVGPDQVREIYGIDPSQVPDFIALRGDPSDGLPGAKGIGAKTAGDLLRRKGDLDHVILGAIRETPSVRKALIEQADELRTFKDIATLRMVALERPEDRATDYAGGSTVAARDRHGPAGQAAQRRGSARLSRSYAVSPTQWAEPTEIGMSTASYRRCAARSAPARSVAGSSASSSSASQRTTTSASRRQSASRGARPSAVPSGTAIRTSAKSRP